MFQNLPTIWAITMKSLAMPKLRQVSESILAAMNLMNRRQFACIPKLKWASLGEILTRLAEVNLMK